MQQVMFKTVIFYWPWFVPGTVCYQEPQELSNKANINYSDIY